MELSRLNLQDMPPEAAHFCLQVERFVHKELQINLQNTRLLLAMSAGLDSTALALCCKALQHRWNCSLIAGHLDHGLRPESSQEAAQVQELCLNLDIPCNQEFSRADSYAGAQKIGLEEAGRLLRYRFLHGLSRRLKTDWILLAHHLNDLAEDMILRQLRGAGWPALAGMPALEANRGLLRPFLLSPKAELHNFVHSLGQSWQEDPSNLDQGFTRNRIRHNILTSMLQENPNFLQSIAQLWRQAELDRDLWDRKLLTLSSHEVQTKQGILLPVAQLQDLHPALRLRWYKDVLQRLDCRQTPTSNLFALDRAWQAKGQAKTVQFPGGRKAQTSKKGIEFF